MIRIICVGKIKEDYLVKMIEDYSKRINKYHKLEIVEIIDTNKKEEGIKILQKLNYKSYIFNVKQKKLFLFILTSY